MAVPKRKTSKSRRDKRRSHDGLAAPAAHRVDALLAAGAFLGLLAAADGGRVALGYGAANMYGGFDNSWTTGQAEFFADPDLYPRYRQFYLSPDIDLSRLPVRSRLLRTLLGTLNFIKIPAPALELNTRGKLRLHALYW